MVHRRSLEGRELVFRNQGALWGDAMTWWDHETGSIWSQPLGEAIAGPLKGSKLELLPASFTTWSTWRTSHPDTLALEGYGGIDFDLIAVAIAVEFGDDAVAYKIRDLREVHVINDTVAGTEIAVVLDPRDDNQWSVFSRRLDDRVVELVAENLQIVDLETGSVWDPLRGIAVSGPLAGEILAMLPAFTVFPPDFETFWPAGRIWQP